MLFGPGPFGQRDVMILWEDLQVSGSKEDWLKKTPTKDATKIRCSQWKSPPTPAASGGRGAFCCGVAQPMYLVQTKGTSSEQVEGAASLGCGQARALGRKSMGMEVRGGGEGGAMGAQSLTARMEWGVISEAGGIRAARGSTRKPAECQQRSSVERPSTSPLQACWWHSRGTRAPVPR